MATYNTSDDLFGVSSFIVDATGGQGNYTTIQSAITAASSFSTIFIRPGTYTEDLTLKAGVNLTAWNTDQNATVNIVGNATFTGSGALIISGVNLQTNGSNLLTVSGSSASQVTLIDCFLSCNNGTGISYSSSNASSMVTLYSCQGNLNTTGIALFSMSSAGTLSFYNSDFTNNGGSSTASTASAGVLFSRRSAFTNPITTSSTNALTMTYSQIDTSVQNAICLTCGGSGLNNAYYCLYQSGSASSISISATMQVEGCTVNSTNTNAITGAGTITYSAIIFRGSSTTINTTTQTSCGTLQGTKQAVSPPAGFLGESITASVTAGAALTITSTTTRNITSINLTAGVWDISGVVDFAGTITGTFFGLSLNTVSATMGTAGDNRVVTPTAPTANCNVSLAVPCWRQAFNTTTTVYLVVQGNYTVGSLTGYGRISAVRTG